MSESATRVQPATPGSTTDSTCGDTTGSGASFACSFLTTPTVGDEIFVICGENNASVWSAPTDNQTGNTYTLVNSGSFGSLWSSTLVGATGTFTVTCHSNTVGFMDNTLLEYSGVNTSVVIDTQTILTTSRSSAQPITIGPNAITTNNANDGILGYCIFQNAGTGTATFTAQNSFQVEGQQTNENTVQVMESEDRIVSSIGSYTASNVVTGITSPGSWSYTCGVAAFESTSSGGGGGPSVGSGKFNLSNGRMNITNGKMQIISR